MSDMMNDKTEEISSPSMAKRKKSAQQPEEGTVAFLKPASPAPDMGGATVGMPPSGATNAGQPATKHDSERTQGYDSKRPPSSLGETIGISPDSPVLDDAGPTIPKQIGNYEILDVLGRGGMGVVYKARQKGLNRMAALKMILAAGHASTDDFLRFQTEAEAVAKLQHPNIVQIFEVNQDDGHPYFSLEYVDGGTLAGKMNNNPLPARMCAEMIEPLARAVGYAHENGILHRDLKPGNILLTLQGTPKITDFGLAKRMGEDSSNHTGTGSILGTPAYMSPEQAEGKIRELGPGVDIYALGSVLYHGLTGRPPFVGETVLDTLQQVKNDDPVPPSKLQPKVPRDIETICLKCLQKEPHKRYTNSNDLADDLKRFLNNEPIKARPVGLVERVWKLAKRNPREAWGIGAILGIIAIAFFGMMILYGRAEVLRFQAQASEEEAKKNAKLAEDNEAKANANLDKSNRTLYAAQMNLAQDAIKEAKINRLKDLLSAAKEKEGLTGFEWNYLNGLLNSELLPLKGHTQIVSAVAFRPPSGKQFASASGDGSIVIWEPDAEGGPKFRRLKEHSGVVRNIAFDKTGQFLASAGEDGVIQVWDLNSESRDPVKTIKGNRHGINSVAFSPNSDWMVAGSDDGSVKIFPIADDGDIRPATLKGHDYPVTDVAISGDGGRIAASSLDKTAIVWDAATHEPLYTCKHDHWVTALGFSADGKTLASSSWDRNVKLWDGKTGNYQFSLTDLPSPARNLAFSPDGTRLAVSCQDHSVLVWDLVTKKELKKWPGEPGKVRTVAFSPDGQLLASVDFDLSKKEGRTFKSPATPLAVSFGESATFAAAGADGNLVFWNPDEKSDIASKLKVHDGAARVLAYNPVRKLWATGGEDALVVLVKQALGDTTPLKGHKRWVQALAFNTAGDTLASGSADGQVLLWKLDDPKSPRAIGSHADAVRGLAFSHDGKKLASASSDQTVVIWDVATGVRLGSLPHNAPVLAVAFQPGSDTVATACADRVIRLWDIKETPTSRELRGHTHAVTCLTFTPDGKRLVSGSDDATIKLWDPATGQETLTLRGHTLGITGVSFSPNASRLVSSSWDQTLRLWETPE